MRQVNSHSFTVTKLPIHCDSKEIGYPVMFTDCGESPIRSTTCGSRGKS